MNKYNGAFNFLLNGFDYERILFQLIDDLEQKIFNM